MPVIVTRDFPPAHGGVQRYCGGLADALAALGERVCVVATQEPGGAEYDAKLPYPVLRVARRGRILTGLATVAAVWKARKLINDSRVIAAIWQPCGFEALIAGARAPGQLTVIAHGSEIVKQRRGLRRFLAYNVLSRADVVAMSRFTADAVGRIGAHARVVPCGVIPIPLVRAPGPQPMILSVGRLVRRKGFDRLIEAMPDLVRRDPTVRLEIIGDGPDRAYLENLAKTRGVTASVTFWGKIDDAARDLCYARAWLFAMPNRTESEYDVEGLGAVFLEAALHGLPSIGGRNSGAEDAIVDDVTGLLVDGSVQAEVTHALARLLANPAECGRFGMAARERVIHDFDWLNIARRVIDKPGYKIVKGS